MPTVIAQPIVDLCSEPLLLPAGDLTRNILRQSQLQYNERVEIVDRKGDFVFINCLEQMRYDKERGWHPYPGWVHATALKEAMSAPTQVAGHLDRSKLLNDASHFLGIPYLWGGTSSHAVDCSGLTYLLYRAQNISIPRDAHDQSLFCQPIERNELLPGDLLFWAPEEAPHRNTHVVLYVNQTEFLESPMTGKRVRRQPLPPTFWSTTEAPIVFLDREKKYFVTAGRIVPSPSAI